VKRLLSVSTNGSNIWIYSLKVLGSTCEAEMKAFKWSMELLLLLAFMSYSAWGGIIAGTVKDPSGVPLRGVFVRSRRVIKSKITTSVLSDKEGRYRFDNLSPGEYQVWTAATGYKEAPPATVKVMTAGEASLNFSLEKGTVRWSDLSNIQAIALLPDGKGKRAWLSQCMICHSFQSKIAGTHRDSQDWVAAVNFMRSAMNFNLGNSFTDNDASEVSAYLNDMFGVNSKMPPSPADLPGYKEIVRSFDDDAMRIVYVDYALPKPNSFPFSAAPDKDGRLWIPEYGRANRIGRLDAGSGEIQEFSVPFQGTAAIHSAVPAPDGAVWLAEQGSNRVGKWDPETQMITEYQAAYERGREGLVGGGAKHTTRVDRKGAIWSSGHPLSSLDPETGKYTDYPEIANSYSVAVSQNDTVWFTANSPANTIGKVDAKGKITTYVVPTKGYLRRIDVDSNGIVWFGEYEAGKIGRFDPKTETFKEYPLPGPDPTPYGLGIDSNNQIWYSSHNMDVLGRLDPRTGQVTEFPLPYSENGIKEFFLDSQGRMWFGLPPHNKVGYFRPSEAEAKRSR
jgi:virginiamycin B lyase